MSNNDKNDIKIKRWVDTYNIIANLFWSVFNLVPISIFCYRYLSLKLLFTFLAIGMLCVFLPKSFFDRLRLASSASGYKKLGVLFFNKFIQNGELINNLVRKRFPGYKVVSVNQKSIHKLLYQSYMFEKFHSIMFLVFVLVMIYALVNNYIWWSIIIFFNNILYNVYPILLQQYLRIKLGSLKRRLAK